MNLRGSQVAHKLLFSDEPSTPVIPITRTIGRNADLNDARNECLVERFFFISHKTKMWFQPAVQEVAPQFFISAFHASKLILANRGKLSVLRKQWKDQPIEKVQKHFSKKWPHLVW